MDQTIDLISGNGKSGSAAEKLLVAAGPLFASKPFDAISTREIARIASVNLSAISYHFGSKEGLYEAVFREILDALQPFRAALAHLVDSNLSQLPKNKTLQQRVMTEFVNGMIEAVTSPSNPIWRMQLMIREIQQSGPCFDLVLENHILVVHRHVSKLVSVILEKSEDEITVKLTANNILTLCLQYGLNEQLLTRRFGWTGYGEQEISVLKRETARQVLAFLNIEQSEEKNP